MFKKIALATALVATASFATWDKFPVLENHKGQAKVGFTYGMPAEKVSTGDLYAGVRYTVIPNLELGTVFNYKLFTDVDGNDGVDGMHNLPLMVRYQFMPILNAFLDVDLPIGEEEFNRDGIGFHFGVQFSPAFGMVNLGTEAGLQIETAGDDKTTPPWTLNLGVEGDFAVNEMFTPYVGIDLLMFLGKTTFDGDNVGDSRTGDMGFEPYLGVAIAFNPMFALDLSARFKMGEDYYGYDDTQMYFDAHLNINF